jgi:hypothetical protein
MVSSSDLPQVVGLKQFINPATGTVNYNQLMEDKWLHNQLQEMENTDLRNFTKQEKLAFWLNAYNLFTIKGVLMELKKNKAWKGNNSFISRFKFFYLRKFKIASRRINLYNLEKKILRECFEDPRIHFAINCASASCPYLPSRLFEADSLDEYLDLLTQDFINNNANVRFDHDKQKLFLNMIFKWYRKDFGGEEGIKTFLKDRYQSIPENFSAYKIEYLKYNWKLNENKSEYLSI